MRYTQLDGEIKDYKKFMDQLFKDMEIMAEEEDTYKQGSANYNDGRVQANL